MHPHGIPDHIRPIRTPERTLFQAVPPISVTRYVRRKPGPQVFFVHSALKYGAMRAQHEVTLEPGQAYTLLYFDSGDAIGRPMLAAIPDRPESEPEPEGISKVCCSVCWSTAFTPFKPISHKTVLSSRR